jgi:hypothetical protein
VLFARPVLLAVATCVAGGGCRPDADRLARAAQHAEPHLAAFDGFERWAHRAIVADSAAAEPQALSELVFAPIRRTPSLIGAWVRLEGERPLLLALHTGAQPPASEEWVAVRDRSLGAVQVAAAERCALPAEPRAPPKAEPCIVIRRDGRDGDQRSVTVTMAFASATP